MVEGLVGLADLTEAFTRMRGHWKGLFEGPPGSRAERVAILDDVTKALETVTAAARVSDEARPYVIAAYRMRLGEWRQPGVDYPTELAEAAEGVRAGFEMRLRTLRQMESGDEVLPDSGRDTRRSAARDICFFHRLGQLSSGHGDAQTPQLSIRFRFALPQCGQTTFSSCGSPALNSSPQCSHARRRWLRPASRPQRQLQFPISYRTN